MTDTYSESIQEKTKVRTNRLEEVRDLMMASKRTILAMAWDDLEMVGQIRDTIEEVFDGTDIMTTVHLLIKGTQLAKGKVIQARRQGVDSPRAEGSKRMAPDTIVIKKNTEASFYANIIREVRDELIGRGLEGNVQGVKETCKGELLITLGKTEEGNSMVRAALAEKMGKTNVKPRRNNQDDATFIVKGIDAVTAKDEIAAVLKNMKDLNDKAKEHISVLSLRPGFASSQTAIVSVNTEMAKALRATQSVRIGLPNCSVKERVTVDNCYRCWETGHSAKNCKGPDRTNACRNCGEDGHEKKNCKNYSKCVVCGGEHPANTTRCATFRSAIARASGKESPKRTSWGTPKGTPNNKEATKSKPKRATGTKSPTRTPQVLEPIVHIIGLTPKRLEELKKA